MGHAVHLRDADVQAAELARRGRADRHRAAPVDEPLDVMRGVGRDAIGEHERRLAEGPAGHRLELLDAGRHATERLRHVGVGRRPPGSFGVEVDERVQVRRVDRGERRVELLER